MVDMVKLYDYNRYGPFSNNKWDLVGYIGCYLEVSFFSLISDENREIVYYYLDRGDYEG